MFFNYFFNIIFFYTAVESTFRINNNDWTKSTKTKTTGLNNLNFVFKSIFFDASIKFILESYRT